MYERLTKCPLCQSGLFINHLVVKDHAVSQESFTICKCSNCNFLFTNPRPDQDHIGPYYASADYISHTDSSTNLVNAVYKLVRRFTLQQKISWINQNTHKKGRLLDFGCGTGHFPKSAQEDGWETIGYEPHPDAACIARQKNGLKIYQHIDELKPLKKFDAITLFHVIEHVHDLRQTMELLTDRLKKRGTLFLAVPNYNSYDAKLFKEHWASLDVPRHLYHFTQETMTELAHQFGLRITAQKPMVFDSYYVSILSNKIKENRKNFIKSIFHGYQSNKYAKNHNNNYSSILFILKKK